MLVCFSQIAKKMMQPTAHWQSTWKAKSGSVELKTVDTWEGLAKSLAAGETDIALMGPWGYVLANNEAGAQAISTILYDDKPEYFAIFITHPGLGHQNGGRPQRQDVCLWR